jgi:cell division transport system permease protein
MARETPLLPVEDAREAALFFVVAALCFLAALAALSAKSTYGAARAWTAEVEGELTVTLQDVDRRAAEDARKLIESTDGVASAHLLSKDEIDELLAQFRQSRPAGQSAAAAAGRGDRGSGHVWTWGRPCSAC